MAGHREWLRAGFKVIPVMPPGAKGFDGKPVPAAGKCPGTRTGSGTWARLPRWTEVRASDSDAREWEASGANVGVLARGLLCVDIDVDDVALAGELRALTRKVLGPAPARTGKPPRSLLLYRCRDNERKATVSFVHEGVKHQIEILGDGQQFVADGIHPGTGRAYAWDEHPTAAGRAALTHVSRAKLHALIDEIQAVLQSRNARDILVTGAPAAAPGRTARPKADLAELQVDPAQLRAALEALPNEDVDYAEWIRRVHAVFGGFGGDEGQDGENYAAYESWCLKYPDMDAATARAKWDSVRGSDIRIGGAYILDLARAAGARIAGQRKINFDPRHLVDTLDFVTRALIEDGAPLVQHGGQLALLRKRPPRSAAEAMGATGLAPVLVPADVHMLREEVARVAAFSSLKGKPLPVPGTVLDGLIARGGAGFTPVTAVVQHPVLLPDGRFLIARGHDATSGVLCAFDPEPKWARAIEDADGAAAAAAFGWLCDTFFMDFPFGSSADPADGDGELSRACAVAALLTAFVRPSLDGDVPAFAITAPQQASGKSALARLIGYIPEREFPTPIALPPADRWADAILSALSSGQRVVFFDNLPGGARFDSPMLAAAITGGAFATRKFHSQINVSMTTNVTWIFTGNNVRFVGDLETRVLRIELDPGTERPDRRNFRRADLAVWARENYARAVGCCLTLLAYAQKQKRAGAKVAGVRCRFNHWSALVRDAILHAGGPDVALRFEQEAERNDENAAYSLLIGALERALDLRGTAEFGAGDILDIVNGLPEAFPPSVGEELRRPVRKDLCAARELLVHGRRRLDTAAEWGALLSDLGPRVFAGLRVVRQYARKAGANRYRIERVPERRTAEEPVA